MSFSFRNRGTTKSLRSTSYQESNHLRCLIVDSSSVRIIHVMRQSTRVTENGKKTRVKGIHRDRSI